MRFLSPVPGRGVANRNKTAIRGLNRRLLKIQHFTESRGEWLPRIIDILFPSSRSRPERERDGEQYQQDG